MPHPDYPKATAKTISPPPIYPHNPRISPANMVANKAANTGSNAKMMAVSLGFKICCAQIISSIAINVAAIPVTKRVEINRVVHIANMGSNKRLFINDRATTTHAWTKKKGKTRTFFLT